MALHNAHSHKELAESVRLLVEAGADINAIGSDHQSALMCASKSGCCSKVLQAFLQNGADAFVRTPTDGLTACTSQLQLDALIDVSFCWLQLVP
jgi:ankyrin repeat protein